MFLSRYSLSTVAINIEIHRQFIENQAKDGARQKNDKLF